MTQYAETQQNSDLEGVHYVDDSQIYDYDHQDEDLSHRHGRPQSRAAQHNPENGYVEQSQQYGRHVEAYHQYGHSQPHGHVDNDEDDDMW